MPRKVEKGGGEVVFKFPTEGDRHDGSRCQLHFKSGQWLYVN